MKTWKTLMLTGGLAFSLLLPLAVHAGPNSTGGPYATQGDAAPRRQALRERWRNMSPDERREAREKLRESRQNATPEERASRRQALRERWQNMSPEERQQLRQDFGRGRHGGR